MVSATAPLLALSGIVKRFNGVEALAGVDLAINEGEVVGLVGDNGAGKSTLCKVITGVHAPDEGTIRLDGTDTRFPDPAHARRAGIEMVYQDLALCDDLSAAMNLFLGRELSWSLGPFAVLNRRAMHRRAEALVRELEVTLDVRVPVRTMSGGQRQAVAIARAILGQARLVLLDEPTAAISIGAVEQVLALIRRLRAQGRAIVLISHRMPDIFGVCDRVVVLRRGTKVADKAITGTNPEEITALITGAL